MLSIRQVAGRRFWLLPVLCLAWPGFQALRLMLGWQQNAFDGVSVQSALIGFPMMLLAIALGVRIIMGEYENRTLEISYTIPGGAEKAWLMKLLGAVLLLAGVEVLLALFVEVLFLRVPISALYGAFQESVFFLVLAMGMAVWSRSQMTGMMLSALVFAFNGFMTEFGSSPLRISPSFNPMALRHHSPHEVMAFTLQNRVGMFLLIAAIVFLTFSRAQRREKML